MQRKCSSRKLGNSGRGGGYGKGESRVLGSVACRPCFMFVRDGLSKGVSAFVSASHSRFAKGRSKFAPPSRTQIFRCMCRCSVCSGF